MGGGQCEGTGGRGGAFETHARCVEMGVVAEVDEDLKRGVVGGVG